MNEGEIKYTQDQQMIKATVPTVKAGSNEKFKNSRDITACSLRPIMLLMGSLFFISKDVPFLHNNHQSPASVKRFAYIKTKRCVCILPTQ